MNYSLVLLCILTSRCLAAPALTPNESTTSPSASLLADSETSSLVTDTIGTASSLANTFRKTTFQPTLTQAIPLASSVSSLSATSTRQSKSWASRTQVHSTIIYSHPSVSSAPHTTSHTQFQTIFRETSSKVQSMSTTSLIVKTTASISFATSMPHLGPGIVIRPSPSPASTLPSVSENDTHDALLTENRNDQNDPHRFPAPVHQLIVLLLVFLGFIGLACGFFALSSSKTIRAFVCGHPKRTQPTFNEKDLLDLPTKMGSISPTANSPRWLKLPTQILRLSSPAPPSRSPVPGRPRNKVIDITPNFPRSRFSDSSSEDTSSIYSDSSSLDEIVPSNNGQDAVLPPSELFTRNSDLSVPTINVSNAPRQYLTVPRRDERWSLEANRLSSISEAESSQGSVQGSEDGWSVERTSAYSDVSVGSGRLSGTSDKNALLAAPRKILVETVRWSQRS